MSESRKLIVLQAITVTFASGVTFLWASLSWWIGRHPDSDPLYPREGVEGIAMHPVTAVIVAIALILYVYTLWNKSRRNYIDCEIPSDQVSPDRLDEGVPP